MKTISLKVRDTSSATFSGLKPSSCILALQQLHAPNHVTVNTFLCQVRKRGEKQDIPKVGESSYFSYLSLVDAQQEIGWQQRQCTS